MSESGSEVRREPKLKTVSFTDDYRIEDVVTRVENKDKFLSREDAAKIFLEIADFGHSGHWPNEIGPWAVGRALGRLMGNNGAPDEYNMAELIRGYRSEDSQRLEDPED